MRSSPPKDKAVSAYFDHSSAKRTHTCTLLANVIREQHSHLQLLITPEGKCDLFGFAQSEQEQRGASYESVSDGEVSTPLSITSFVAPRRRTEAGGLKEKALLGKYRYRWNDAEYLVYLIDGRDGQSSYPQDRHFFLLHEEKSALEDLVLQAGRWTNDLHREIWVFDGGYWQKSADLFESIQGASWENVILEEGMKKAVIEEHLSFFRSRDIFRKLQVPWKRGLLYYGPPGNGKTISIKATMNMLYKLQDPIPTLYVRTLTSYGGPEQSLQLIFDKARSMAPCYMVFEDLDTIVTDNVKSYFFNEVDGLKANDGIFMIGSTNHIERLDPGISQRPSRFDRKYLFPDPSKEQRVDYCHFWQKKLKTNKSIEFPNVLCTAIAGITDRFSFAYLQEAFVATLLAIAKDAELRQEDVDEGWLHILASDSNEPGDDELDKYILWREMKKQVDILRQGLPTAASNGRSMT